MRSFCHEKQRKKEKKINDCFLFFFSFSVPADQHFAQQTERVCVCEGATSKSIHPCWEHRSFRNTSSVCCCLVTVTLCRVSDSTAAAAVVVVVFAHSSLVVSASFSLSLSLSLSLFLLPPRPLCHFRSSHSSLLRILSLPADPIPYHRALSDIDLYLSGTQSTSLCRLPALHRLSPRSQTISEQVDGPADLSVFAAPFPSSPSFLQHDRCVTVYSNCERSRAVRIDPIHSQYHDSPRRCSAIVLGDTA